MSSHSITDEDYYRKRDMCSAAYDVTPPTHISGYELKRSTPCADAFRALAYKRDRTVIVAVRGSVWTSLRELHQNFNITCLSIPPNGFIASLQHFIQACRDERVLLDGDVLELTGHSLGGAVVVCAGARGKIRTLAFDPPGMLAILQREGGEPIDESFVDYVVLASNCVNQIGKQAGRFRRAEFSEPAAAKHSELMTFLRRSGLGEFLPSNLDHGISVTLLRHSICSFGPLIQAVSDQFDAFSRYDAIPKTGRAWLGLLGAPVVAAAALICENTNDEDKSIDTSLQRIRFQVKMWFLEPIIALSMRVNFLDWRGRHTCYKQSFADSWVTAWEYWASPAFFEELKELNCPSSSEERQACENAYHAALEIIARDGAVLDLFPADHRPTYQGCIHHPLFTQEFKAATQYFYQALEILIHRALGEARRVADLRRPIAADEALQEIIGKVPVFTTLAESKAWIDALAEPKPSPTCEATPRTVIEQRVVEILGIGAADHASKCKTTRAVLVKKLLEIVGEGIDPVYHPVCRAFRVPDPADQVLFLPFVQDFRFHRALGLTFPACSVQQPRTALTILRHIRNPATMVLDVRHDQFFDRF